MTTADEKMRDSRAQHAMMMRSPEQQDEAIIRHYAATAALAMNGVAMVDAKRYGQRGDALDAGIAHIAALLKKAHRNDFGVSLLCTDQASSAQSAERIKELNTELSDLKELHANELADELEKQLDLEQQNEQLQAQVADLVDVLTKCGRTNFYERRTEVLNFTTQTAEAYKRRVQEDAYRKGWKNAANWSDRVDLYCDMESPAFLAEMSAELKEGEQG